MNRPAFIADLLEAAGKAKTLKYSVTCNKPGANAFILLASPNNILDLARYIEELEAENKKLKEALKPFTSCFGPDENLSPDDESYTVYCRIGDLRRAAALGEKP